MRNHILAHKLLQLSIAALIFASACSGFTDEGVDLGRKIAREAEKMRKSGATETVVRYEPAEGVDQKYSVGMGKMVWCPRPPCLENQGSLSVEVERGNHGSTTVHVLSVAVPQPLMIEKAGAPTWIRLRMVGDTINVVDLR